MERLAIRETAKRLHDLGATFALAQANDDKVEDGFLYLITHPSWPGVVKIGCALNPESRLGNYQTGCPRRAYQIEHYVYVHYRRLAESHVHDRFAAHRLQGEWFAVTVAAARSYLNHIEATP